MLRSFSTQELVSRATENWSVVLRRSRRKTIGLRFNGLQPLTQRPIICSPANVGTSRLSFLPPYATKKPKRTTAADVSG